MLGLPCHPAVETVVPSGPRLVLDGKEKAREGCGGAGLEPQVTQEMVVTLLGLKVHSGPDCHDHRREPAAL